MSDALDAAGLPPGQPGFLPLWGWPKVVGFAVTVQMEPWMSGPTGAHLGTTAVATAEPTNVMVIANEGAHRRLLLGRSAQPGRIPARSARGDRRRRMP